MWPDVPLLNCAPIDISPKGSQAVREIASTDASDGNCEVAHDYYQWANEHESRLGGRLHDKRCRSRARGKRGDWCARSFRVFT